jgi:dTMP kinase
VTPIESEPLELSHAPKHSLRAVLQIRDFRRLWMALGFSSLGDWMGLLALTAMASNFSESYAAKNYAIAGVLLLRVLPALVLGPFAGYVADRVDRRKTLIVGDVLRGALFITIPIVGELWWVFVVTVLVEALSLIWGPAKDATIPNLVPTHRLTAANQIGLATSYGSALPAAIVFTALTAFGKSQEWLVSWTPQGAIDVALYLNGLSFWISAATIYTLTSIPRGPADAHDERNALKIVIEGWTYVARTPLIRGLVLGVIGAFAAGGVVIALARTFVEDIGGGEPAYGVLFGAVFLGLALGMWGAPSVLAGFPRRRLFGLSLTGAGIMLFPLALIPNLNAAIFFAVALGIFSGSAWITGNTMLGLEVPDAIRGRTLAFVASMIRLSLALVLFMAPAIAGLIGHVEWGPTLDSGKALFDYRGAAVTMLLAAILMTVVGIGSYRQMDDRKGTSLLSDLRNAFSGWPGVYASTGVFVALEGGEGAGKSTQSRLLREWLENEGYDVVLTREPGDTQIGQRLRDIVLDPATGAMSPRTEALLYAADKAEHVDRVVGPALQRGAVVVTDRYVDSTLAYQGAGRELDAQLEGVARWATQDLRPHLTILLDLPPGQGLGRFEERDRIEAEGIDFHEKVRERFLELASTSPEHYAVLDGSQPPEELAAEIRRRIEPLLSTAVRHD